MGAEASGVCKRVRPGMLAMEMGVEHFAQSPLRSDGTLAVGFRESDTPVGNVFLVPPEKGGQLRG